MARRVMKQLIVVIMSCGLLVGLIRTAQASPAGDPAPDKAQGAKADAAKSEPAKSAKSKAAKSGEKTSERPAEKAESGPAKEPPVKEPVKVDDGAESTPVAEADVKLGPFQAPPRPFPFPLLGDDRAREVFVDRAGNLYKERPYSGNVPDWNAAPPVASGGRCHVEPQVLNWVGFQNNADGSRVYLQLEKTACGYVYRPDDLHIVIDLPQVTIASGNLRREILTGAFPTAIEMIRAEEVAGKGTRVVVVLREHRPYLSAHLGKYLFVDVTR